jgi:Fur family transcriptional regulator, ferric uptake regulator
MTPGSAALASTEISMPTLKKGKEELETKELHQEDRILNDEQRKMAMETFARFLAQGHYRSTSERFKVLEAVLTTVGHFNADELYASMVLGKQRISRATVYSTLELLEKAGLITKHNFRGERSYYEVGFDEPHHDHLICTSCGHITEFVHAPLLGIRKQIAEKAGLKVVDHSFQIFAECADPAACPHKA